MKGIEVVQEFLDKADIKAKEVQTALGVTGKGAQVFWALLNAAGDDLVVTDANKVAGKLVKFPSPLLNTLAKKKLIKRGDGRGKWNLSDQAVEKMKAVLRGDAAPEAPAAKPRRKKGKKSRKKFERRATSARRGKKSRKRSRKQRMVRRTTRQTSPGKRGKSLGRLTVEGLVSALEADIKERIALRDSLLQTIALVQRLTK